MTSDVKKIAQPLVFAGMRFDMFAMVNTSGLTPEQQAELHVNFQRARRDIAICEADLKKAIEYYARTGY